eukprot:TRINITY_DN36933_c0_g1_i1.p1 TRINITY_DN36933_c0_g1~~TRINITY_DN36933_c0_g1_i1.p1  ORF type:complete len:577 (-),score=151.20 TRINITY_DN36933_c0_g1_i1:49-1779(-)
MRQHHRHKPRRRVAHAHLERTSMQLQRATPPRARPSVSLLYVSLALLAEVGGALQVGRSASASTSASQSSAGWSLENVLQNAGEAFLDALVGPEEVSHGSDALDGFKRESQKVAQQFAKESAQVLDISNLQDDLEPATDLEPEATAPESPGDRLESNNLENLLELKEKRFEENEVRLEERLKLEEDRLEQEEEEQRVEERRELERKDVEEEMMEEKEDEKDDDKEEEDRAEKEDLIPEKVALLTTNPPSVAQATADEVSAQTPLERSGDPSERHEGAGERPVSPDALLMMGIYTAPTEEGRARREEIRNSFWKHPLLKAGGPVKAKFVVGWTDRADAGAVALRRDVQRFPRDFLHVRVKESYGNLTRKTLAFFRWFAQTGPARYVLKMDDDTFPHLDNIVGYLNPLTEPYLHLGLLWPCAPVLRTTKWAEDRQQWNHSFFPKYMQGSGYFLSLPLARELAGPAHFKRSKASLLRNEDAAVGVWIEKARWEDPNIKIVQRNVPTTLTGCRSTDLLSMNNQIGYMKCYWRRYMRSEKDVCCRGPLKHLTQSLMQVSSSVKLASRARAAARARTRCYSE